MTGFDSTDYTFDDTALFDATFSDDTTLPDDTPASTITARDHVSNSVPERVAPTD